MWGRSREIQAEKNGDARRRASKMQGRIYALTIWSTEKPESSAFMTANAHIVINTCPDSETARKLARVLVEENLAACVNIIDGVRSIYRWNGEIQDDGEVLLLIKSGVDQFSALRERLQQLHPYELPEIVAVPISDGLPEYLDWLMKPNT